MRQSDERTRSHSYCTASWLIGSQPLATNSGFELSRKQGTLIGKPFRSVGGAASPSGSIVGILQSLASCNMLLDSRRADMNHTVGTHYFNAGTETFTPPQSVAMTPEVLDQVLRTQAWCLHPSMDVPPSCCACTGTISLYMS